VEWKKHQGISQLVAKRKGPSLEVLSQIYQPYGKEYERHGDLLGVVLCSKLNAQ